MNRHLEGEPLTGITAVFHRKDIFYLIQFCGKKTPIEEAKDHAKLNPGTLRIEAVGGEILWELDSGNE